MPHLKLTQILCAAFGVGLWIVTPCVALAVDIPGSADVGRIRPAQKAPSVIHAPGSSVAPPSGAMTMPIPKGAKAIRFTLKEVKLDGVTAFTPTQIEDIYTPYLGKEITLDIAYMFAGAITERYRNAGYFLSLAYVPNQEIGSGVLVLKVVEGYVSEVDIESSARANPVIRDYIDTLTVQKPLTSQAMESFLLRLNDLPGYSFSGVLSALNGGTEGAVKLTVERLKKEGSGTLTIDNNSSRFLGPHEGTLSYSTSLLPLHQTTVSGLSSIPTRPMHYISLEHSAVVMPDITLTLNGAITEATPGFTLTPYEIESSSTFISGSIGYQWIRQRDENLSLKLALDSRDSSTDLLGFALTRDHIRALRATATYDGTDRWYGSNTANLTISRGISGLGASKKGALDISRAEAVPDFTKAELSLTRAQGLTNDWSLFLSGQMQRASGPLFSSEEFGYGGQTFGRAFDASEITGDHGINGSLELRYSHWGDLQPVSFQPYAFYDVGAAWNDDLGQAKKASGSSAGVGLRAFSEAGVSGNVGLAWPLNREISTPLYNRDPTDPRIIFQINKSF
jgi:hemolysin activation/secretion protein